MKEPTQKRLLFVDDDPAILESLRRLLRHMRNEWDMAFASNGEEALTLFETKLFDVMITDIRMPGMDGVELLRRVSLKYPKTIRFVLSGQSETEAIIRSIGLTHQYLSKPCSADNVKIAISRAFALRDILEGDNLKQLISRVRTLPSLPSIYTDVMNEIQSPDASLQKIAAMIEKDIGMSAKVLQLINSAFFGLPQHVTSPSQAVCLLGLNILKSLVCMFHMFQQFENLNLRGFSLETLWDHCSNVAAIAQKICVKEKPNAEDMAKDAFMAGLFHDLGKLVLLANLPDQYEQAITLATEKSIPIIEAEYKIFGATHAETGAYLLGLWGFSNPIIEASAFHHQPGKCVADQFSSLTAVHAANALDHELSGRNMAFSTGNMDMEYFKQIGMENSPNEWRELFGAHLKQEKQ